MRDRVGRREKIVGVFILVILAAIVVAFAAVSVRDERGLFNLAEGTSRGELGSLHARELRVARSMMPSLGTAGWALDQAVALTPPADLPDALNDYGVRSLYRGRYVSAADPEQYVEVEIYDAGLPENAFALLRRFAPREARPVAAGNEGWTLGDRGGFWAGRYYTQFDRSRVRTEQPGIKVITDALASVQITYGAPIRADEPPFPPIELPGWDAPDNVRVFNPTNLWEKIDGRADLYLAYNVATLTFGTYRSDKGMSLDVYWYDMTEADNAFGIYQSEYGGHAQAVDVGRQGYTAGGGVFFWKGAHYVRVEAAQESPGLSVAAQAVAAALAAAIPDDGKPLWADAVLPQENRLPDSFEYHASDAFGLDFLSAVFSADYQTGGQGYTLFVHRAVDPQAAAETLAEYVRFFEEYGKVLDHDSATGTGLLIGESGGVIDAVFVSGQYLGGANGVEDLELARRQAVAFRGLLGQAASSTEGGD